MGEWFYLFIVFGVVVSFIAGAVYWGNKYQYEIHKLREEGGYYDKKPHQGVYNNSNSRDNTVDNLFDRIKEDSHRNRVLRSQQELIDIEKRRLDIQEADWAVSGYGRRRNVKD